MWFFGTGKTIRRFAVQLTPLNISGTPEMPELENKAVVFGKVITPERSTFFICSCVEDMEQLITECSQSGINISFFTAVLEYDLVCYYDVEMCEEILTAVVNRFPPEIITAVKAYGFNCPHLVVHFSELLWDCTTLEGAQDLVGITISQYTIKDAQRFLLENPKLPWRDDE